ILDTYAWASVATTSTISLNSIALSCFCLQLERFALYSSQLSCPPSPMIFCSGTPSLVSTSARREGLASLKELRKVDYACAFCLFALVCLVMPSASSAQTPVLTQHNNNARTGAYTTETVLTPTNVNQTTFGKLFSYPVDGRVYAQPLYVPNLAIAGKGAHNVIFIA